MQYLLAHAQHAVNLFDTQPVQDIRHQSLESHVLDSRNVLRASEVLRGSIGTALSGIVDHCRRQLPINSDLVEFELFRLQYYFCVRLEASCTPGLGRKYLRYLSKCPAFLSEVDDNTTPALLGFFDGLLNAKD